MEPLSNINECDVKKEEDWMNKKWRPAMGWMYMAVCIFDFILAPILWAIIQFWETQAINDAFRQWQPITLQGAGLFHMAMGAVLGLTAWGRTQEKITGTKYDNITVPPAMPTTNGIPSTNTVDHPLPTPHPARSYGSDPTVNKPPVVRPPIRPMPPSTDE